MTRKALLLVGAFFTAAAVNSGEVQAPAVVPTEKPALVLKGCTLADVQANEISGTAIGTHMRPRNMIGYNKVMLPTVNGQPARLRVEMQMMDSYHLKCIVLELFDGADLPAAVTASVQQQVGAVEGVYGRAVAASYVLTKDHGLGWKFVNADGSLNGTAHPLVTNPKGAGYGIADLTLVPRDIDVGGNCGGRGATALPVHGRAASPLAAEGQIEAARGVIARFAGEEVVQQLTLEIIPFDAGRPVFEVLEKGRRIRASNGATLCKAFYTDVTRKGAGICSWSGNRFDAKAWANGTPNDDLRVVSPFRRHLYMQPCTASYTTAFWNEARWMREIDWMALHGYDLPNAVTAFEAILERVWKKHGLTDAEIEGSFAGPAYLAFSRMSCVDNAISHLPAAWRKRSVPLQHAICRRLRSLGMDVMAQGFAGAVPAGLKRVHPNAKMEQLTWAARYHSWFLYPDDPLFVQIGAEVVREWEKEFGKGKYYLCDSFIEMSRSMPWLKEGDEATLKGLETCGRNIYGALKAANPDAVWALQGWIFYNAPKVWTKDRADAFLSAVPPDKMLLVDNCVDNYNMHRQRHFQWNWVKYDAYNGRRWAWSPIPDFGGNTVPCGDLPFYVNGHLSAIASGKRGALYAFGTMTEAIEVLDDVFEVLSAAGWRDRPVEIVDWLERYSLGRWGMDGAEVRKYWQQMLAGVYGNGEYINMGAKFSWQKNPTRVACGRHWFPEMLASLKTLHGLATKAGGNPLFQRDFAVQTAHVAGKAADLLYTSGKPEDAVRGDRLLEGIDAVLAGHPTHDLRNWIAKARACAGGDGKLADYYETDARRIITVWAPGLGDYAARVWSGLVANYYLPRLRLARAGKVKEINAWQNKWVEERLPIAPPAPGWTCEKLVDELVAAWEDFSKR
ncbi:MAG: alpha-N-acetylglucosaminidase C-terminal domain-containing protein [Kiritimatiellae bacterium]|nr:alpha-N-acetylglucosaminidase C-terminal domain-containing protein [Kiritimatiellia bacterium]